jgi:SAM-dependent methyltransferase
VSLAEFTDPRLVAIYDAVNAYAPDAQPGFFAELAVELGATTIVDLGCGTGMITCALVARGHRMIGVDPSPAMLSVARARPDGASVRWVDGGPADVAGADADLAIMSGHVAQFFLTDDAWHAALVGLRAALRPSGVLAFETRNPAAREWESWTWAASTIVEAPGIGRIETWPAFEAADDGIVSYSNHYRFAATGEELVAPGRLRFRSQAEIEASLAAAGFGVDRTFGDWDRRPFDPTSRELIVVATR